MDRYAVLGHPIKHSLSPQIHSRFASQTQRSLEYSAIELPVSGFKGQVNRLFAEGYQGFNVTVPFKGEAFALADKLTERARRAQAVNTLWRRDGDIFGDTTDGSGLMKDLTEHLGWRLAGRSILLLGAGGAARGVVEALLELGPARLTVANRTLSKATALTETFSEVVPTSFQDLSGHFDLIINGTSASLQGGVPAIASSLITPEICCYDMMYSATLTPFLQWAKQLGAAHCADGLGMLVGQAAESFRLWHGVKPQVLPVIEELRRSLKG